jgi:tRNA-specific 2-thiouridylase
MVISNKKKVICAMSGGLDSSVAAALLKNDGFDVVGVFMKFWSEPGKDGLVGTSNRCCSPEAEIRARKVAKILKIPFYVVDFSNEFKERIVDYFLDGYKKGITPNPCVVCNKEIKFGLLLEKALSLGTDFVATGHYARKKEIRENSCLNSCKFAILGAKDKSKDQSYFLWMINQEQLKKILFPIGDYTREEVENLARKFKLPVLGIKKSVEICFIQTTINDFLRKYLKEKPGKIVDTKGKILGEHKGLWFYTIGQRKRIGLSGGPWWVLDKDLKKNFLIVTKNEKDLLKKELICKNVNWILGKEPKLPLKVKAKIRYKTDFTNATIHSTFSHLRKCANVKGKIYKVVFKKPQRAITPGQSVVFYKGEELLGGGIIQ